MIEAELSFAECLEDIMQVRRYSRLAFFIKTTVFQYEFFVYRVGRPSRMASYIRISCAVFLFEFFVYCLGDGRSYKVPHSRSDGDFSRGYKICPPQKFHLI